MSKTCQTCGTVNAEAHRFCQRCGRPFDSAVPIFANDVHATQRWASNVQPARQPLSKAVAVGDLFGSKNRILIGRAPDCDVKLDHPTVSRYHAFLERASDGLQLRDLNSVNGVLVGGQRISHPVLLKERERVGVGPYLFTLADGVIYTLDSSQCLRLEARSLAKSIGGGRGRRVLLDSISFAIEPGEFVGLLGPSGSGKSTLMDCLNGRRPATLGRVLANGEDFYRHYDSFRMLIGYVPQRDIVHTQLTVYRALRYTALLRLPSDTSADELEERIEQVLTEMELWPHRQTLVANLSGGQIKRVSLGAELLARPCLLYLDEATSGLDAGTEARLMRLFRGLADAGKTIICITHNIGNVDRCNLILMLFRGRLVYYGPPGEAASYFGVRSLSDIYNRLAEKEPHDWTAEFTASPFHKEFVVKRLPECLQKDVVVEADPAGWKAFPVLRSLMPEAAAARPGRITQAAERPYRPRLWHQFWVLTARYAELLWCDRRSLRLLFLQAPLVAAIILLGFMRKDYDELLPVAREPDASERKLLEAARVAVSQSRLARELSPQEQALLGQIQLPLRDGRESASALDIVQGARKLSETRVLDRLVESTGPILPTDTIVNPRYTYMLLFLLTVTMLWFGCNNAAREIVKEEAVYGRERAVNLGIVPYLGSKFLVLSVLSALQALLLMGIVYGVLELLHWFRGDALPHAPYRLAYVAQYGVLVLLAMTGVSLGLFLSACVSSPDRANSLLPYVLIPQIILGGGIMSVNEGVLHWLGYLASPVYWGYRGIHLGGNRLPSYIPGYVDYPENVLLVCVALLGQTAVLLCLSALCLRRKDIRRV